MSQSGETGGKCNGEENLVAPAGFVSDCKGFLSCQDGFLVMKRQTNTEENLTIKISLSSFRIF